MKRGKKYRAVSEKIESNKLYSAEEAMQLVRESKIAKFDESVEVHVKLAIDPKQGDQQVRGSVVLPHGVGKAVKIAVVTSSKTKDAQDAGADIVGGEELIEKIKNGKAEAFDVLVASPEMMPKLAQVAKILGPRGLMPSPKTDTVTDKIKEAVEMLKKGKMSFKNDNTANVHQVIGKVSFDAAKLKENYEAFMDALQKAKPAGAKGKYVTMIAVCSTMGPSIKVQL
ncbi:MAG TPA: 50S ribosomal protein L1 [Patescibacteria group bacterium]